MEGLPVSTQLSSNPVVTAVLPGSNITVNKTIGDVTVSSGGGGGGTQTKVSSVFENGTTGLPTGTYATLTTLTVVTTTANSLITISHGFNTNSDGATFIVLRTVVNGAVIAQNPFQLQMVDDISSGTLSLFYRAGAAGTYTIVLEGTRTGAFQGGATNIFSYALSNLNG